MSAVHAEASSNADAARRGHLRQQDRPLERQSRTADQEDGRWSREAGNLAIQQLLRSGALRAKLTVSHPADAAEEEADRMAETFSADAHIARKCSGCAQEDEETVRRKALTGAANSAAGGALSGFGASSGHPLPRALRRNYERFFDADLASVRVHTDAHAAEAAHSVQAHAFTLGRDIYFGSGQYQPESDSGRRLLAHELTHVVQQGVSGHRDAHAPGAGIRARPEAEIQRQWWLPLTRIGPGVGRYGPMIERVGPSLERIGPALERVGPSLERVGPSLERTGPGLDRLGPQWRPWGPEWWRAPPEIGRPTPTTPAPAPQPFPWAGPYPPIPWFIPWTGPQPFPQPQPLPEPEEEEQRDPRCGTPELPLTRVSFTPGSLGQGRHVKASPLTKCPGNTRGTEPDGSIYRAQFDCINAAGEGGSWVRAHLLHGRTSSSGPFNLHGPGYTPQNLIITDKSLNGKMRTGAEAPAITRVWGGGQVLWYEANVDSYVPGLDFFAQSITVNFGRYDPATNTEGPREGGGTFSLKRTPPNCPATPLTGGGPGGGPGGGVAGVPGVAAPGIAGAVPELQPRVESARPPASAFNFQSTIRICYRVLESRTINVANGGLMVRIDANWFDPSGEEERSPADCPITQYHISLRKTGLLWDDEIGTANMTVGRGETIYWRHLDPGEYYLYIWVMNFNPTCCLTGDIIVSTFDAPPASRYVYPEDMIA